MLFRRACSGTLRFVGDLPDLRGDEGQSSIELLGMLPVLVLLVALGLQAGLAGQAWWLTRSAADAAARAQAVGAQPQGAARRALPQRLRRGMKVTLGEGDTVRVRVRVPSILGVGLGTATAEAQMESQQ